MCRAYSACWGCSQPAGRADRIHCRSWGRLATVDRLRWPGCDDRGRHAGRGCGDRLPAAAGPQCHHAAGPDPDPAP
ncbi:hypothetical protein G6F21_014760 [Rhizopus arrhizus]|nr:hypothetical protein G6F21_014760 [Rhizopus arrhizus]